IANIEHKDYSLLFPIFEHGFTSDILVSVVYLLGCFAEITLLLLLQHHLKKPIKLWQLIAFVLFIIMLAFGPTVGAIAEFGPVESAKQRFPAYEQWKLIKIGMYIEHLDFLSVYQWFTGTFIRSTISLYL